MFMNDDDLDVDDLVAEVRCRALGGPVGVGATEAWADRQIGPSLSADMN